MDQAFIKRIIRQAGGPAKVSKELGITSSAVSQWKSIPAWYMAKVSALAGIPVDDLLPPQRSKPQPDERKAS